MSVHFSVHFRSIHSKIFYELIKLEQKKTQFVRTNITPVFEPQITLEETAQQCCKNIKLFKTENTNTLFIVKAVM